MTDDRYGEPGSASATRLGGPERGPAEHPTGGVMTKEEAIRAEQVAYAAAVKARMAVNEAEDALVRAQAVARQAFAAWLRANQVREDTL